MWAQGMELLRDATIEKRYPKNELYRMKTEIYVLSEIYKWVQSGNGPTWEDSAEQNLVDEKQSHSIC